MSAQSDALVFFHGTSTTVAAAAAQEGLVNPFLTDDPERAAYYAECAVDDVGGAPVVLEVQVPDTSILRYDGAAMDEPVMADEAVRDAAWDRAAAEHPEWLRGEFIIVPEVAWQVSWAGVGSVRVAGRLRQFSAWVSEA